jgi:hypothetical protein
MLGSGRKDALSYSDTESIPNLKGKFTAVIK